MDTTGLPGRSSQHDHSAWPQIPKGQWQEVLLGAHGPGNRGVEGPRNLRSLLDEPLSSALQDPDIGEAEFPAGGEEE
jgi:hypothetical protein